MKQIILYIVILLVAAIVMRIITQATKRKNTLHGKYTAAPLLSNHEKAGFKELLAYCTEHNLLVFTKVRLIDLVQPKKRKADYRT